MGNLDLDFKTGYRICNRTRNPKTDFKAEISVFEVSILQFDWESEKGFEKLSFRTVVLPTSFQIRVRLQNLKFGFQNLNPDFPIKHDLIFRVIFFRTPLKVQSNAVNTDTEGPYRQSVLINGVSILSGLNLEKM